MNAFAFAARSLVRQPGRAVLGIAGIAATGALLFDMLMLSRGLVVSMESLLKGTGFDVRVTATLSMPPAGPRISHAGATVAAVTALPEIDEVVPLRIGEARLNLRDSASRLTLIGADAGVRRPWTLVRGRDLETTSAADPPMLVVNRSLWDRLQVPLGTQITVHGTCTAESSAPPMAFRVSGVADFPFDEASEMTAVTTLRALAHACGNAAADEVDMLMIASRSEYGPDAAAHAIRRVRPDVQAFTNEELVARFEQVEFSYFRQISFVLASITMLFGLLLITVLLAVSTNQRFGEIAALRALGFSQRRMMADVLWHSALLVGTGGLFAIPLGLGLSIWLDALLKTMPGIPASLHFFVFEPQTVAVHVALLIVTTALAAIYPMRIVAHLPIAGTLRQEVIG